MADKTINKIYHLADLHIRNLKRHKEYREVFNKFLKQVKKDNIEDSIIYIAGDIAHAKTEMSPELVQEISWFLTECSKLREVVLITGVWALVCSLISAFTFYIGGTVFINLLTSIEPIRVLANDYLIWVIIMPILTMACYHLDGIFLGTTQTSDIRNGMVISLIVFVGLTFWLIPNLQNDGLWISFSVFFIMRAITLVIRYRSVEKSII